MAAFDSAARCEQARLFARDIRNLSPNDRERLLALFAAGAEEQARAEAKPGIAYDAAMKKRVPRAVPEQSTVLEQLAQQSEVNTLAWWSASKCVPLRR